MRLRKFVTRVRRRLGWLPRARISDSALAPGVLPQYLRQRGSHERAPALTRPPTIGARSLDLPEEELVLGVEHDGLSRAYPLATLWRHHIVNDVVGEKPVLVAFCLKCFSGMSFDPLVEGRYLEFETWGRYLGGLVIEDDQTKTLWAHLSGEALAGPLVGRQLSMLPIEVSTLRQWVNRYPDSTTPDPKVMADPHSVRPGSRAGGGGIGTVPARDDRLPSQALILGVRIEGRSRAYLLDPDYPGPRFFQDELGGVPIALFGADRSWPLVFDRRTSRGVVDLEENGEGVLDASGSKWDSRGRAVEGPLSGTSLPILPSRIVEWYAWSAYYPDTDIAFFPGPA
jgi:hypothetical protein